MHDTFDKGGGEVEDRPMTAPTREEFEARLETAQVRMDARVSGLERKIEALSDRLALLIARLEERFARIDERFARIDERFARLETAVAETQASVRQLRTTIIVTGITSVLAVTFGLAALLSSMQSTMLATFRSGQDMARDQAEIHRQAEQTAKLLRQLQEALPAAGRAQ